MEAQWTLLIIATVVLMVTMFAVGYWLEGLSSSSDLSRQADKSEPESGRRLL